MKYLKILALLVSIPLSGSMVFWLWEYCLDFELRNEALPGIQETTSNTYTANEIIFEEDQKLSELLCTEHEYIVFVRPESEAWVNENLIIQYWASEEEKEAIIQKRMLLEYSNCGYIQLMADDFEVYNGENYVNRNAYVLQNTDYIELYRQFEDQSNTINGTWRWMIVDTSGLIVKHWSEFDTLLWESIQTYCKEYMCNGSPSEEEDVDGDGMTNSNPSEKDIDGDGKEDGDHTNERDTDGDGIENGRDLDVDCDALWNGSEEEDDIDGDEIPDDEDEDDDGDEIPDEEDEDGDGDGEDDGEKDEDWWDDWGAEDSGADDGWVDSGGADLWWNPTSWTNTGWVDGNSSGGNPWWNPTSWENTGWVDGNSGWWELWGNPTSWQTTSTNSTSWTSTWWGNEWGQTTSTVSTAWTSTAWTTTWWTPSWTTTWWTPSWTTTWWTPSWTTTWDGDGDRSRSVWWYHNDLLEKAFNESHDQWLSSEADGDDILWSASFWINLDFWNLLDGDPDTDFVSAGLDGPIISRVAQFMLRLVVILAIPMLLYSGITIMLAAGDEGKLKEALKNIAYVVVWVMVALASVMIVLLIISITNSNLWNI